jgi:hypothetical protein
MTSPDDLTKRAAEIDAARRALPEDERLRVEAADAPYLRIQLAHKCEEAERLRAELDKASTAAAKEIWTKMGLDAVLHWKQRAEHAESALERVRAIHNRGGRTNTCNDCGQPWPCEVTRALDTAEDTT